MTPEQEAAIRARHERCVSARFCFDTTNEYDHVCDTAVVLAALDSESMERADAERQSGAARADVVRLAEWLREALTVLHQTGSTYEHHDIHDMTGWHIHGIETCADGLCVKGLAFLAALAAHEPAP